MWEAVLDHYDMFWENTTRGWLFKRSLGMTNHKTSFLQTYVMMPYLRKVSMMYILRQVFSELIGDKCKKMEILNDVCTKIFNIFKNPFIKSHENLT